VRIEIRRNPPLILQLDKVLVQRLLGNVLSNAIDASRTDSVIAVDIQRIESNRAGDAWARLRVVDSGEGISGPDLRKIATGYFTTKATGDEQRGFGLGLAICRKIVHLHGGNLDIASQPGKGTTVRIDLPLRQTPAGGKEAVEVAAT
jgi:signal transduction histidine kinase